MRRPIKTALTIFTIVLLASSGFAEEKPSWEKEFTLSLQKAKATDTQKADAYGYTQSEEDALKDAIQKAMDSKAPPCEAMKIAVDLKYKAHSVIKNIFSSGGEVDLNQLCMCATEKGVSKEIFAQAATDAMATDPESGEKRPVFLPDEVTQAQCFTGLGYTEDESPPEDIPPPPDPNPESGESVR
ncbi:MAG: hypothetical protein ABIJ59_12095 [Pseudomonadota bacterium]